ncbi:MAG: ComF family protein [Rickettsiales bacterium]|jgi:ComF family protein|nr:ComF family protein [Rickettsiales bacterium]
MFLSKPLRKLFDLIFPYRCLRCEKIIDRLGFCDGCMAEALYPLKPPLCRICGGPLDMENFPGNRLVCASCLKEKYFFDRAVSVFYYSGHMPKIIHSFKFGNKFFLSKFFFEYLREKPKEFGENIDCIVPIPLHVKKLRARSYNQTALLARHFRDEGYKVINDLLLKTVNSRAQIELKTSQRKKNVRGNFCVNKKYAGEAAGKNILLLDDVFTTGATVNECAKVLREGGAKKIFVLTIAKVARGKKIGNCAAT